MRAKKEKKAISEMLSYVILVSIAIGLSIGVFVWLKTVSNVTPTPDCNEGTSLILENSSCNGNSITINIKNNGLFNLTGILVSVGNDTNKFPVIYLLPSGGSPGTEGFYYFVHPLAPEDNVNIFFTNINESGQAVNFKYIRNIQIQPFVYSNKKRVFCANAVIKQQIPDCEINSAAP